jgi:ATPase subunit of ABC transporter with duplicated ATPase domains
MTSHDREFMNRIIGKVIEIDGGQLTTYSGNYEFYEAQRELNQKQQQAQFERQQAMLAKEIKFIERFKARASHAAQVQSRVKKLEKIERVEPPRRRQTVAFDFLPAPRSGEDVVSLKRVQKAYGSRVIYDGLDFMVRRKERWCVMGVNGAGKSTLLKLVAGSTVPDDGTVALGGSAKMGYFASMRWICSTASARCSSRWRMRFRKQARARCARLPAVSDSPAMTLRRNAGYCRAARRRGWSWQSCSTTRQTSWCSTSPPTISTWRPRRC